MEVYQTGIRGCSSFKATYHFLPLVSVIDVWGNYLFIGVVGFWYVQGVEAKGHQIVGEIREPGVVIVLNFWFTVVIDRFLHHFNSGGGSR